MGTESNPSDGTNKPMLRARRANQAYPLLPVHYPHREIMHGSSSRHESEPTVPAASLEEC
jgi:hypothetical protein